MTMHNDCLAMEHYRLHVMEQWPDGPVKAAGLAAVRSTLEALESSAPAGTPPFVCAACLSALAAKVLQLPVRSTPSGFNSAKHQSFAA